MLWPPIEVLLVVGSAVFSHCCISDTSVEKLQIAVVDV